MAGGGDGIDLESSSSSVPPSGSSSDPSKPSSPWDESFLPYRFLSVAGAVLAPGSQTLFLRPWKIKKKRSGVRFFAWVLFGLSVFQLLYTLMVLLHSEPEGEDPNEYKVRALKMYPFFYVLMVLGTLFLASGAGYGAFALCVITSFFFGSGAWYLT